MRVLYNLFNRKLKHIKTKKKAKKHKNISRKRITRRLFKRKKRKKTNRVRLKKRIIKKGGQNQNVEKTLLFYIFTELKKSVKYQNLEFENVIIEFIKHMKGTMEGKEPIIENLSFVYLILTSDIDINLIKSVFEKDFFPIKFKNKEVLSFSYVNVINVNIDGVKELFQKKTEDVTEDTGNIKFNDLLKNPDTLKKILSYKLDKLDKENFTNEIKKFILKCNEEEQEQYSKNETFLYYNPNIMLKSIYLNTKTKEKTDKSNNNYKIEMLYNLILNCEKEENIKLFGNFSQYINEYINIYIDNIFKFTSNPNDNENIWSNISYLFKNINMTLNTINNVDIVNKNIGETSDEYDYDENYDDTTMNYIIKYELYKMMRNIIANTDTTTITKAASKINKDYIRKLLEDNNLNVILSKKIREITINKLSYIYLKITNQYSFYNTNIKENIINHPYYDDINCFYKEILKIIKKKYENVNSIPLAFLEKIKYLFIVPLEKYRFLEEIIKKSEYLYFYKSTTDSKSCNSIKGGATKKLKNYLSSMIYTNMKHEFLNNINVHIRNITNNIKKNKIIINALIDTSKKIHLKQLNSSIKEIKTKIDSEKNILEYNIDVVNLMKCDYIYSRFFDDNVENLESRTKNYFRSLMLLENVDTNFEKNLLEDYQKFLNDEENV